MPQKFLILTLFVLISFFTPAQGATGVGTVIKAAGSAVATGNNGKRAIRTGSPVFQSDTIKTGFSGEAHIVFSDKTKLTVGPRSTIKIASFVPVSGGTASKFAIRAARGTFRFITGRSKKGAYKISTKTATIGIRGTGFDFAVKSGTSVLLYVGSVRVCTASSCTTLSSKCDVSVQSGSRMQKTSSSNLPPNAFRLTFPYVSRENRLPRSFRLNSGACDSVGDSGHEAEGADHDTGGNTY